MDCGYSLEPPRRGGSTSTHNLCFEQKYEKYQSFSSENFQFLEIKLSIYLNRRVFVMCSALIQQLLDASAYSKKELYVGLWLWIKDWVSSE